MALSLHGMVGATMCCLSLDNDSIITYNTTAAASYTNYYATNVQTWYKKSSESTYVQYNPTSILGRPAKTVTGAGTGDSISYYEPLWMNPHWFHNKWRWYLVGLDAETEYNVQVRVGSSTASITFTTVAEGTIPFQIDGTLSSDIQNSIEDLQGVLLLYFKAAGLNGTSLSSISQYQGLYFTYDATQAGVASAVSYGRVILGANGFTDYKNSLFDVYFHELEHYFGVGNNGGVVETGDRVNYFTNSNNYIDVPSSADYINKPGKRASDPPTGYYRYPYSNSCLDAVFQFCQGNDSARVIRFLDHSNISEATNNLVDAIFLMRALYFEDVTIVNS